MLPQPTFDEIINEIASYERQDLEGLAAPVLQAKQLLEGHRFVQIQGLSNFWLDQPERFWHHVLDFVISAHSYSDYLTFVIAGAKEGVTVYLALEERETAVSLLKSAYHGLIINAGRRPPIEKKYLHYFKYSGLLSGIPSRLQNQERSGLVMPAVQLERVVRGLRGQQWIYVVQAYPRPRTDVIVDREILLEKIAQLGSLTRQQMQRSRQATQNRTNRQTESVSEVIGGEIINRQAEYAIELMERELERLETTVALGRWQVGIYFGAPAQSDARRLGALLTGLFSGTESRPDPVRAHYSQHSANTQLSTFQTYLHSDELSLLLPLLREESPGYAIHDLAKFDVDFKEKVGKKIVLGRIRWDDMESEREYEILQDDLTRHGVVLGVTGSGKTTTLLNLLYGLWRANKTPFLVVEPAKTEYRALIGRIERGHPKGPLGELQVYTLGNDMVAPFRLNPFEFDLGTTPNDSAVLSHIDFLKAVFNAAFILYAPMPYVLETALFEIYEDKGWNLATGQNIRLPEAIWSQRDHLPIFPTLSDLYHKVASVTTRLGYEARIEQDVIAGLKARLGALRLGAKGLMLDTPRGIPIEELLKKPTVLELESIGNDEEKTFIMGLLLARLYGYRRLQAAEGKLQGALQHILVIEEAHRLLKQVNDSVSTESANLRAQAVETFVNMLSEVRHYGQGVLVAEQIPSKLTSRLYPFQVA